MTIKPDFLVIPTSYFPVGVQFTFPGWQPWDGDGLGARERRGRSGQRVQAGLVSSSHPEGQQKAELWGVFLMNLQCRLPALLVFLFPAPGKGHGVVAALELWQCRGAP